MNQLETKRGRGRPPKANPLTPVQRSRRYRASKRAERRQALIDVLEYLSNEAAKPNDRNEVKRWQKSLTDQHDRIEQEFQESLRQFDSSGYGQ